MSTTATTATGAPAQDVARPAERPVPARTPFPRVLRVELRKMFNTRSGFWLMMGIAILAALATIATVVFVPGEDLTYSAFASAVGLPMGVVLPIVAILAVSSEWSQRTALTTFTLVPSRGRVLVAKLLLTVAIGAVSMVLAAAIGALGNVGGSAIAGVDPTWDVGVEAWGRVLLAQVIGMLFGFMLGVVLRSSPAAIVGYFVCTLVLPGASAALGAVQSWWAEHGAWFDQSWATTRLFDEAAPSAQAWAQIGVSNALWILLPLAFGTRALLRAEVK
ncbi:ABC transporter permease [Nocardioides sp. zg-536]|uniref:ABC transporter permease n=1 Tax=Nocardioides faecalis TaxID=2803858 RepID=A0A938Y8M1_9ACTN|nr:ABC transporter permease [Nocardioides faecalis]MBM9459244.1 ABC transporter permease [Nocardioides faecalis]QVI59622.1 ABC transporter permease [Nocardioides faecalis]